MSCTVLKKDICNKERYDSHPVDEQVLKTGIKVLERFRSIYSLLFLLY